MKLASLKKTKELVVVSPNLKHALKITGKTAPVKILEVLENWDQFLPTLSDLSRKFKSGQVPPEAFAIDESDLGPCLERAPLFADGSAFIQHVKLVRMARKAPLPETLETVPLMYQGECARFLAPDEPIPQIDFKHGTDFEAEVGVVTSFVPMGTDPTTALKHIRLLLLINDVSLRGLIPEELAQGFGFFQSKPASALSPFALTPDELGNAWKEGRVHLPLLVQYNGKSFGHPNASEMHFHFGQLIAHAARTRDLQAGTIIGSGTVSNENNQVGSCCLAEVRMIEQIKNGSMITPFMKVGDSVTIEMKDEKGQSLFGKIHQEITNWAR